MKNFQHLDKREPDSIDIPFDATLSMNKSGRDSGSKKDSQNVAEPNSMSDNTNNVGDRIRNYWLNILIFILTCHAVFGEIKNGYEKNIAATKQSLTITRARLQEDDNLSSWERRKIQAAIATLVDHVAYYDLTEGLLMQFKAVAPELYAQVDTIRDRLGRKVDVYIKFIPVDGTSVKAWGITYMDQACDDKDAYVSEFGKFSVSVKIWIVQKALLVLAHELGHVNYQVQNLASYFEFYKKHYAITPATNSMGHDIDDPSGKSAIQFGRTFQKKYAEFIRVSTEKVKSPLEVLALIKKSWSKNVLSNKFTRPNHEMKGRVNAAAISTTAMTWASLKTSFAEKSTLSLKEHQLNRCIVLQIGSNLRMSIQNN